MNLRSLASSLCGILLTLSAAFAGPFEVKQDDTGVVVTQDGKLVTHYLVKSNNKPILWPIVGPTGKEMTRAYPMRRDVEGEKKDHPHHRSLWWTHGEVNGVSFWIEEGKTLPIGVTAHREFSKVEGGEKATIATKNDWNAPDGKRVLEDERTIVISRDAERGSLLIDFNITLKATDGEVHFGDTKEGCFGLRVPTSMDVDAKKGGKIVTSEGLSDAAAWGKPAAWVDYHGPVGEETLGMAVLNHPSSFRYPTHWHVRTYGLFAANPFGLKDFSGGKAESGEYKLPKGESITLKYRVAFHKGDEKEAGIAKLFEKYSHEK